jgi:cyanophycinase
MTSCRSGECATVFLSRSVSREILLRASRRRRTSSLSLLSVIFFTIGQCLLSPSLATAGGRLFIIGGGLRSNNSAIFEPLLELGGGAKNCRIAIFRTASNSTGDAIRMSATLQRFNVPADQITLMDIEPANASVTAFDAANVELLSTCNIFYFTGGSQFRIVQSLTKEDGSDTPVLAAIRKAWNCGAIVAGTSAGAAMQSEFMLAVSGLPDDVLDEGMDALDFGSSNRPDRRGLLLSHGLSFLDAGIIDQHFGQYRGRLGRLSRALIEQQVRYGFGVDENTVIIVSPEGFLDVRGAGSVTIVDAKDAKMTDGPLGCHIEGLRISCIEHGDRFEPTTGTLTISPRKLPVEAGWELNQGNYLVTDIAGRGALRHALFQGLGENTARKQIGIWLRYSQSFGHGYRFTFRKTDRSRCWAVADGESSSYAVQDISLSIEPILSSLQSPETSLPIDLPDGQSGIVCETLWFRGILSTDGERRLHPAASITRAELAMTIANAIHFIPPPGKALAIPDVAEESSSHDAISRLLEAKLFELDSHGRFRPDDPIPRQNAARVMLALYTRNGGRKTESKAIVLIDEANVESVHLEPVMEAIRAGLLNADSGRFRPTDCLTRQETAEALFRILDFEWTRSLAK